MDLYKAFTNGILPVAFIWNYDVSDLISTSYERSRSVQGICFIRRCIIRNIATMMDFSLIEER